MYKKYTICLKKNRQKKKNKETRNNIKNMKRGKGVEDEVPFLLNKQLEKHSVYQPELVSKMLTGVLRESVRASIARKRLMDTYREYRETLKEEKKNADKQIKENNKRLHEIERLLLDPKILLGDGPSRSTRASKKKNQGQNSEYRKLLDERDRLRSQNNAITYRLSKRIR